MTAVYRDVASLILRHGGRCRLSDDRTTNHPHIDRCPIQCQQFGTFDDKDANTGLSFSEPADQPAGTMRSKVVARYMSVPEGLRADAGGDDVADKLDRTALERGAELTLVAGVRVSEGGAPVRGDDDRPLRTILVEQMGNGQSSASDLDGDAAAGLVPAEFDVGQGRACLDVTISFSVLSLQEMQKLDYLRGM